MSEPRTGIDIARAFYVDHVAARLDGVPHAAALIGDGSEVLGFDDEISTDHDFRTRVQVFVGSLAEADKAVAATRSVDGEVEVAVAGDFFAARLGFDPADGVTLADWLTTPTQRLATLTEGAVFHDVDGLLGGRRDALAWYPDDVWRYVLAAAWLRVSQHEPFVGRTGGCGDNLGSALIGARIARDVMRLAFLLERSWAPYDKWFGTAFARLTLAGPLAPRLHAVLAAEHWREREAALNEALTVLARATNDLDLAADVDPSARQFYTRDIRVVGGARFTDALVDAISDAEVTALVESLVVRTDPRVDGTIQGLPGAIDQVTDSVDVLRSVDRCRALAPALGLR